MFKQHGQTDMRQPVKTPNFETTTSKAAHGSESVIPAYRQNSSQAKEVVDQEAKVSSEAKASLNNGSLDLRRIVRLAQLLEFLGLSRSTVYLRLNPKSKYHDPKFPKPVRLGAKAVGWLMADVCEYIDYLHLNKAH